MRREDEEGLADGRDRRRNLCNNLHLRQLLRELHHRRSDPVLAVQDLL
jgi:hypothetical protein